MAIQKLIVCLSSLIILTSRSTSSLPQGLLNNFGLPVQNQEFGQRPLFPGFQPLPSIPPPTFIPIKQTGPQSRLLTKKNPAIPEPHIAISDNSTLIHEGKIIFICDSGYIYLFTISTVRIEQIGPYCVSS